MERDKISKENLDKVLNVNLDGIKLYGKKDLTVEEIRGLAEVVLRINGKNNIAKISLENINIPEGYDISTLLSEIGKKVNHIQIKNCKLGNLDSLMQGISGKEDIKNDFLKASNYITEFEYNKKEKTMNLSTDRTDLMRDFSAYVKPEKLNLKMYGEEDKLTLAKNMRAIQEAKFTDIRVEDATQDKHLTEMEKYESYANGNIVVFQSQVLKETLGFDRLPTNNAGMRYNIKIDGRSLVEKGLYKLEGKQALAFLTDLRELSRSVDISGISLKNIEFPQSPSIEEALSEIFEKVDNVKMENTKISDSKQEINQKTSINPIQIEEKSFFEKIKGLLKKIPLLRNYIDRDMKKLSEAKYGDIKDVHNGLLSKVKNAGKNLNDKVNNFLDKDISEVIPQADTRAIKLEKKIARISEQEEKVDTTQNKRQEFLNSLKQDVPVESIKEERPVELRKRNIEKTYTGSQEDLEGAKRKGMSETRKAAIAGALACTSSLVLGASALVTAPPIIIGAGVALGATALKQVYDLNKMKKERVERFTGSKEELAEAIKKSNKRIERAMFNGGMAAMGGIVCGVTSGPLSIAAALAGAYSAKKTYNAIAEEKKEKAKEAMNDNQEER